LTLAAKTGIKGLGRWVTITCATLGISLFLFSFSTSFWLSAALLLPAGYSMMLQMACSNTLIQTMVPDQLRGRVMSLYSMMFMGMAPFGAFFGGALAHRIGAPITVAVGGIACVLGAIWFGRALPELRIEARRLIIAQGLAAGEPAQELNAQPVEE
jgi:MFS family permease